ncbi:MAG: hypothetical protein E7418_04625 [Ruminococcaceae bacterium]|nr:hypothetical protein [Oscillospiraceae bacterium]
MEIKIYIDVLLAINFLYNYILLQVTGLLLKMHVKKRRILLASCAGALYAAFAFFAPDSTLFGLLFKLIVGSILCAVAYRPSCFSVFCKQVCVFYASVFILGGALFACFYFFDCSASLGAVYRNGSMYINLPLYLIIPVALVVFLLLHTAFSTGRRRADRKEKLYTVRLYRLGNSVTVKAFYDTGNMLTEEISGKSVMIAEWNSVRKLFPGIHFKHIQNRKDIVFVGYRSLQGGSVLPAFLPDKMYVEGKRRIRSIEPMYVGLVDRTLDYYHAWKAILPHTFEGEESYERNMDVPLAECHQAPGLSGR